MPPLRCEQHRKGSAWGHVLFWLGQVLSPSYSQREANMGISTGLTMPVGSPQSKIIFPDFLSPQNLGFTSPPDFVK